MANSNKQPIYWQDPHPEENLAGLTPKQLKTPGRDGTHRGIASTRPFHYEEITLEIEKYSLSHVCFTTDKIAQIRQHILRFGHDEPNEKMVARLENIVQGSLQPTAYDIRFYTHELREYCRYISRGWFEGTPTDSNERHRLWNSEHTATLEDYGIHERRFPLYHPEVLTDEFFY